MLPMNERGAAALTGERTDHRTAVTTGMPARGAAPAADDGRPLIAHVIFRLAVGGLENGLVNLINRMPQYRHAIICLTVYTDFHQRIRHDAVSLHALNKRADHAIAMFVQLWRLLRAWFAPPDAVVGGTVGRLAAVKDQVTLARAFVQMLQGSPQLLMRARLVIVGDGPLRHDVQAVLAAAGFAQLAWLPGARDDVAELMRALDIFVLPSLAEGISNTVLEAMACALPFVATRVGGNSELVIDGTTGALVPAAAPHDMAMALARYVDDVAPRRRLGAAGRARVEREFSMDAMVARYVEVYEDLLQRGGGVRN